jgi:hypothetical protein
MRAAPFLILMCLGPLVGGCVSDEMVSVALNGTQHSTAPTRLPDGAWVQPEESAKALSPEQAKAVVIARLAVERHERANGTPTANGFYFSVFELANEGEGLIVLNGRENRGWAVIVSRGLNAEGYPANPDRAYRVHVNGKWDVASIQAIEDACTRPAFQGPVEKSSTRR